MRGAASTAASTCFLIETVFDTLNAKAAIVAALDDGAGASRSGSRSPRSTGAAATSPGRRSRRSGSRSSTREPLIVGVNCSLGAARDAAVRRGPLAASRRRCVACYPNAGLPNAFGGYDEQPDDTSRVLGEFARDGLVNIVGGCCGTTPDHIRAIVAAVDGVAPRSVPEAPRRDRASAASSRSRSRPTRTS